MKTQQNDSVESPHNTTDTTNEQAKFAVIRKTTHGRRSRTKDVALGVRSYGWHLTDGQGCASLTLAGPLGESFVVEFDIATFDAIGEIVNKHRVASHLNNSESNTAQQ